jgi:hypothetical protein
MNTLGDQTETTPANHRIHRKAPAGYVITVDGLRRRDWPNITSEGIPPSIQVDIAKRYLLANWVPSVSAEQGSYWLKHEVERHSGISNAYCSNGALIQAALELGFRIEPYRDWEPSVNARLFCRRPVGWAGRRCERLGCRGDL